MHKNCIQNFGLQNLKEKYVYFRNIRKKIKRSQAFKVIYPNTHLISATVSCFLDNLTVIRLLRTEVLTAVVLGYTYCHKAR